MLTGFFVINPRQDATGQNGKKPLNPLELFSP